MSRRRARLVIRFLVLGCITSVLVAWCSSLWAPLRFPGQAWYASEQGHTVLRACTIQRAMAHDIIRVYQPMFLTGPWRDIEDIRNVPLPAGASWKRFDLRRTAHAVLRAGWPFRCLEADITSDSAVHESPRQASRDGLCGFDRPLPPGPGM